MEQFVGALVRRLGLLPGHKAVPRRQCRLLADLGCPRTAAKRPRLPVTAREPPNTLWQQPAREALACPVYVPAASCVSCVRGMCRD